MSTSTAGLSAFLFTDIEGSSLRWLHHRAAMEQAVARHDGIIRRVVAEHDGEIFKTSGDAFYIAFARPADAVNAAVAMQRDLQAEDFSAVGGMKVRMAVHVGSAERRGSDYFGPALNRTARLIELAHGGQILTTASLPDLLAAERDVRATFDRVGMQPLDDPAQPVGVYQVVASGLPENFPPLRTAKTRLPDAPSTGTVSVVAPQRRKTGLLVALAILAVAAAGVIGFLSRSWMSPAGANSRAPASAPEKSVAVLPFENLSKDEENAFFTNGIQDEILTDLARISDLKVISRSSVQQYRTGAPRNLREIGPALGVIYLLEGSVQRAGGKVRVNAQLIDSRTDTHVWADRYDRELADVFAIQSEIAEKIAGQLKAQLLPREKKALSESPTRDLTAFDLYLRAQDLRHTPPQVGRGAREADETVRLLSEAVRRDPNFFSAWLALAEAHLWFYFSDIDTSPARLAQAQAATDTAARLRPDAGETHIAKARLAYWGHRDYDRARGELALAEPLLRNNATIPYMTGLIDRRQGRWSESNRNMERALELDPRNIEYLNEVAESNYIIQRRYADAERLFKRLVEVRNGSPRSQAALLSIPLAARGDPEPLRVFLDQQVAAGVESAQAVAEDAFFAALQLRRADMAERILNLVPSDLFNQVFQFQMPYPREAFVGKIAQLRGDEEGAQKAYRQAREIAAAAVLARPENLRARMVLAKIDSALGRHDEAIREGQEVCEKLPISVDAIMGSSYQIDLAIIEAKAGKKDDAIARLTTLVSIPSFVDFGYLKLDSDWDSLRDDPRFQALLEKLAPTSATP